MFETLSITRMAEALASHAGARLSLIARNVAQADTPGFKATDLPDFSATFLQTAGMRATRPGHFSTSARMLEPVAQATGGEASPDGNTVSLEREMVKSVEVRQQHDMALAVYRSTADIVRTSLGAALTMADLIASASYSASGMAAQAARLRHVAENISNVDTPGYHRKLVSFHEDIDSGEVSPGPVLLDRSPLDQIYDPGNPLADATGHFDGSNVDLMVEIADAREAQRSYEANLKIFDQARQMTQGLFDLLRR